MDFNEVLETNSNKVEEMDIENRKIIVWGMGHVASLNDNAFKTEQINIYAYTSKEAAGGKWGGLKSFHRWRFPIWKIRLY